MEKIPTKISFKNNYSGSAHGALASYGMTGAVWDTFGELLSANLNKHEAVRVHLHASRAWNQLIAFIVDNLRASFETSRRQLKSSASVDTDEQT